MKPYQALQLFCEQFNSNPELAITIKELSQKPDAEKIIKIYDHAIPVIEKEIWKQGIDDDNLKHYQTLFHELENLYSSNSSIDKRHHFIITIPVADRPQHLKDCLDSIYNLCKKYNYGGLNNNTYSKVSVLVADDSKQESSKKRNKELSEHYTEKGLTVDYFSQAEQQQIVNDISKYKVENITGDFKDSCFYHKGASITRNISYLKLKQLEKQYKNCLFYFIDSDQEFQINIQVDAKSKELYALNYFYYLDKIFSKESVSILTGKVVGDPPVSPAVMAGTFLQDIIYFLQQFPASDINSSCRFHQQNSQLSNDASYHDMPELFGFKKKTQSYIYQCPITRPHSNLNCFEHFIHQINHFFDGEHPTRKSYYQYENTLDSVQPARTIYTGNYIFKPENLKYFIPFAPLKLRMAGPVLGRILKSELGNTFVCANLPMLHKRTVDAIGQSEFRPGVDHKKDNIDLSGEFHRQFFGDVMLFSVIELCESGYPEKNNDLSMIKSTVLNTIHDLQKKYLQTQKHIDEKINELKAILNSKPIYRTIQQASPETNQFISDFINNIEFNFKNHALIYKEIKSEEIINQYLTKISDAIYTYKSEQSNWEHIIIKGILH